MNPNPSNASPSANSEPGGILVDLRVISFRLWENSLQVLLDVPNPAKPLSSRWRFPGGELPVRNSPDQFANQILLQITGQSDLYLEQLYTYFNLDPCPEGRITITYFAMVPVSPGREIPPLKSGSAWVSKEDLSKLSPGYHEVGLYALRRLQYKLEYTAAGFQFLPEVFTLSELQSAYEAILGEKLDKRNFRRRILTAGIIEPTPQFHSGDGRPARLYRYRADAVAEVKARRLFP